MMAVSSVIDFVSRVNGGLSRHQEEIRVPNSIFILKMLYVLYQQGIIHNYQLQVSIPTYRWNWITHYKRPGRHPEAIEAFLFFRIRMRYQGYRPVFKLELMPKYNTKSFFALKRVFTDLHKQKFPGFYVLRTKKGIYTTPYLAAFKYIKYDSTGGEVLFRVRVVLCT